MLLLVILAVACAAPLSKAASSAACGCGVGRGCPTDASGAIAASLSEPGAAYLLAAVLPLLEAKVGALNIPDLPFNQDGFAGADDAPRERPRQTRGRMSGNRGADDRVAPGRRGGR